MAGDPVAVTVGDLMVKEPVTLRESDSIGRAIDLIRQYHLRVLPVVNGDSVVGVVTPEQLLRQPLYRPVGEVRLRDIEPATPDLLPVQAQALLARHGIGALPVAQDGRLVGWFLQKRSCRRRASTRIPSRGSRGAPRSGRGRAPS